MPLDRPSDAPAAASVIEIRIREVSQILSALDPSPFRERDLDRDAEEHIVSWARELPRGAPLAIVVHAPREQAARLESLGLVGAVRAYFAGRARIAAQQVRELFRVGRRYLLIGVPLLAACLFTSQFIRASWGQSAATAILSESLVIVGWVANWRPIETFLYDWQPLRRQQELYERLSQARVTIVAE